MLGSDVYDASKETKYLMLLVRATNTSDLTSFKKLYPPDPWLHSENTDLTKLYDEPILAGEAYYNTPDKVWPKDNESGYVYFEVPEYFCFWLVF
ncbi:hypothetical protein AKJ62_03900 [candidate division MSBL1 archaeon SCGC-AAA259D14]|uniref:Uncharacterized protein n=1 Tax=candidate division MSBL1 archaeon SCGC-AAA259D14 TaxID=1698261 RepID=A0A133U4F6_9EURY|nr:hypothetical protein AKJ62_03900 [candidate division MSBL1 archaeon SCGC-AAA259D14]